MKDFENEALSFNLHFETAEIKMRKYVLLIIVFTTLVIDTSIGLAQTDGGTEENIPVATRWSLDAAGETGRSAIKSIYLIVCTKTSKKVLGSF